jgi:hypothetical protein
MSTPLGYNDTCDIYHPPNTPPAGPDVAGVKCFIYPRFTNIHANFAGLFNYTHVLLMPLGTDVRDSYPTGGSGDNLYIPQYQAGAGYITAQVQFVARKRVPGGNDYLEVYALMVVVGNYPTIEGG